MHREPGKFCRTDDYAATDLESKRTHDQRFNELEQCFHFTFSSREAELSGQKGYMCYLFMV